MATGQEILDSLDRVLKGVDGLSKQYQDTLRKAADEVANRQKILAAGTKRTSDAFKDSSARIKDLVRQMAALKAQSKEVHDVQEKLEKQAERLSKGYARFIDDFAKLGGQFKKVIGVAGQFGSILGVQSLEVKTVTDRYVKYNQALFNLSRVQTTAGKGTKDLQTAFKNVRENTTLAKDQFAGLAAEVGNLSIGLAPASSAIADVAVAMKDRFGPATDVIIAKTKEFFQIQAEWPDLADDIQKAQDAIARNDQKGAEQFKTSALMKMQLMGKSAADMKNAVQMIDKPTQEQLKGLELNEKLAKVVQTSGDLQIAVAEKMAPAIMRAADATEKLLKALQEIPGTLALISGSMTIGGLLGGLGTGGLLKSVLGKFGTKGLSKAGGAVLPSVARMAPSAMAAFSPTASITGTGVGGAVTAANVAAGYGTPAAVAGAGAGGLGLLARGGLVGAAGAAGYGAGKLLDWGVGKVTGKSLSTRGSERLTDAYTSLGWNKADAGAAAQAKATGKKTYGAEYSKKMVEAGGFDQEAMEDPTKFLAIHDKITKELRSQVKNQKDINKETKGTTESASDLLIKYTATLQNQKQWIDNLNKGASAFGELVSLGEKLMVADEGAAASQMEYAVAAREVAKGTASQTIKTAEQAALTQNVSLNVDKTRSAYEQLKQAASVLGKEIAASEKDQVKTKELLLIQRQVVEQIAEIRQQDAAVIDAMVAKMSTQLNINNSLNDIYENRLSVERQLMETAQFGLGASVEMMQQQVDLAERRIESNKEALEKAVEEVNLGEQLSDQQIERLQNARNDMEIRSAAHDIAVATNKEENKLLAYAKQYQTVTTDSLKQQQKILEITKQVREGYLSAMKQSASGFGQFSKIIGMQGRGFTQLMNLVKGVRGSRVLNTFAAGGQQSRGATAGGLGTTAAYELTTSGVRSNISKEEERARMGRTWQYEKTAAMATGRGGVGTGLGGAANIAVLQAAAASRKRGGKIVTPTGVKPDITKGTTAVEKGSQYSPGAILPGQMGIPLDYAGGGAVAAFGAKLISGSKGQVSDTTGGPSLPRPAKGTKAPDWFSSMTEKQNETNTKLNDILKQLQTGLKMTAMQTA